jgi:hypothetical protein
MNLSIRRAAALAVHWDRKDIEAVVLMMTEISSQQEAEDLVTGLLMLRDRTPREIALILAAA